MLTDGSIEFKRIEEAIRKIFGEAVDEVPSGHGQTYWGMAVMMAGATRVGSPSTTPRTSTT